jgi:hypothetical protein
MAAIVVLLVLRIMARTMPSFGLMLTMQKADLKPFCNASDKSDRRKYDEEILLFDIPRLCISDYPSSSSHTLLVGRSHVLISILLHAAWEMRITGQ